jgi:fluoride ion exporter CrcB/FEX
MFSYILVMLGGALGTGARFWMSGFIAERGGEFFPLGTLVVNVSGSFVVGFFAAFTGSEGPVLVSPRFSAIFHDWCVRRLHNVFIVQLTNTRFRS